MDSKKAVIGLVLLVAVAAVFGLFSRVQAPGLPAAEYKHLLAGTTTPAGYYSYTENAPYYLINLDYPATTTLQGAADAKARLAIEQALKDRMDEFLANGDFAHLTAKDVEIQGLGEHRKYALGMTYQTYESPDYVSYVYTIYEDTLGAHPNGYYVTLVFNRNGERVSIGDILAHNPNGLEELSLLASTQAVNELKRRIGVDDVTGAVFPEGLSPTKENYSNFYVEGDTLHILFPPYQIAAYAAGSFNVAVPLKDLQ